MHPHLHDILQLAFVQLYFGTFDSNPRLMLTVTQIVDLGRKMLVADICAYYESQLILVRSRLNLTSIARTVPHYFIFHGTGEVRNTKIMRGISTNMPFLMHSVCLTFIWWLHHPSDLNTEACKTKRVARISSINRFVLPGCHLGAPWWFLKGG